MHTNTAFKSRVPAMSDAQHEAYVTRELAKLGLRRGRRFRGGVCVFDPAAEAARAALSGVASKLTAAVATPAPKITSKVNPTTKMTSDPGAALRDALRATDRLIGRRRH